MPTMTIVSCKIMQDEILWILENDPAINEIIVVDNENIGEFVEKLDRTNIIYKTLPLSNISPVCEAEKGSKYTVLIYLMELVCTGTLKS